MYTAKENRDSLTSIKTVWTLNDVLDFHLVLDEFEDARERARKLAQTQSNSRR